MGLDASPYEKECISIGGRYLLFSYTNLCGEPGNITLSSTENIPKYCVPDSCSVKDTNELTSLIRNGHECGECPCSRITKLYLPPTDAPSPAPFSEVDDDDGENGGGTSRITAAMIVA